MHLTNSQHEFHLPNELPACVSIFMHTFQTNIKTKCFSSFTSDASAVHRLLHGELELKSNPYASRYVILYMGDTTGSSACSVINNNDGFYILYPHGRDINGMPCETGTAILLHFSMLIDCVRYVMQIVTQLTACQFTLTFVDISVIENLHISTIPADTCNNDNCIPWSKEKKPQLTVSYVSYSCIAVMTECK